MRILTLDNTPYNLETLPEEIDDLRFAILDNSVPANVDYHFIPLIFLESFNSPALDAHGLADIDWRTRAW
jgi:hypothetical protein